MTLRDYLLHRLVLIIPTFLGITLITFFVIQLAPGNPAAMKLRMGEQGMMGDEVTHQIVEQTKALYGLDKPIWTRYLLWLRRVVTFDFGESYKTRRAVSAMLVTAFPATLALTFASLLVAWGIGVPAGIIAATRPVVAVCSSSSRSRAQRSSHDG